VIAGTVTLNSLELLSDVLFDARCYLVLALRISHGFINLNLEMVEKLKEGNSSKGVEGLFGLIDFVSSLFLLSFAQ
jgi:hypothetical protein